MKKTFKTLGFLKQALFIKTPRIGYVGGFQGHKNLGDEALYASLKGLFSIGNFIDYNKGLLPEGIIRRLPGCDLMLLAGGTLVGGQKESSYQWAKTCFDLSSHRIIFGSGVVSPDFVSAVLKQPADTQKKWVAIIKSCDYVGVRGPLSRSILEDWGIPNIEIIGDPVLSLSRSEMSSDRIVEDNIIGFNVGQAQGSVWGSETYIFEQFVNLSKIAHKAGFRIKWFVVWPQDLPVTREIVQRSGVQADILEFYEDYNGYMDAVSNVIAFIGTKLHAVALATCAYVPSVMLEYNPKCKDFMDSIGQGENSMRTDVFTAERAWETASKLLTSRAAVRRHLFEEITKFRKLQSLRSSQICAKLGWPVRSEVAC